MDRHFERAPLAEKMAVLLALLGIWNRNFLGAASHAVLPYDDHLHRFPAHLQQLEMESSGKRVRRSGEPVDPRRARSFGGRRARTRSTPFINCCIKARSACRSTSCCPLALLWTARSSKTSQRPTALPKPGRSRKTIPIGAALAPPSENSGNRPGSLLLIEALSPEAVGALVALYEHKVYSRE